MPMNRRGSYGRRSFGMRPVINSMKNTLVITGALSGTQVNKTIAKAVNSPSSASAPEECVHGSIIKSIWVALDVCGTGTLEVANNADIYLMKNPGASLTPPSPIAVGTSNEKKFVIKQWHAMIMSTGEGNAPIHWEGWLKIPKRYWRMGTDDLWQIVSIGTSGNTGLFSIQAIYKWYS